MNKLQKDHLKSLKRKVAQEKHRKFNTAKEGRLKVKKRVEKEHRKRLLAELLKEKPKTTSGLIWEHHQAGSVGYEP